MIYGDQLIRDLISKQRIIEYADDCQIEPASVDLRLGDTWLVPVVTGSAVQLGDAVRYNRYESDSFVIHPGQFILATTIEKVNLPSIMAAFVQGRSSIGRIGLTTQNAGFVDPGFSGHITLELVNESPNPIILRKGYRVAQLVFLDAVGVRDPYSGKYNGQVDATGSRMQMDK